MLGLAWAGETLGLARGALGVSSPFGVSSPTIGGGALAGASATAAPDASELLVFKGIAKDRRTPETRTAGAPPGDAVGSDVFLLAGVESSAFCGGIPLAGETVATAGGGAVLPDAVAADESPAPAIFAAGAYVEGAVVLSWISDLRTARRVGSDTDAYNFWFDPGNLVPAFDGSRVPRARDSVGPPRGRVVPPALLRRESAGVR